MGEYSSDEFAFAPNPRLQGSDWEIEFPPIQTESKWLINKYTGEIVPNTVEFAARSDILMPYLGEVSQDNLSEDSVVYQINEVLHENSQGEELTAL